MLLMLLGWDTNHLGGCLGRFSASYHDGYGINCECVACRCGMHLADVLGM